MVNPTDTLCVRQRSEFLSGNIKVSPAGACGDAPSADPAAPHWFSPPSHSLRRLPASPSVTLLRGPSLVYTASAPFTGGDCGAAKAAETITISCLGPALAAVTGIMCSAAQSSCCFRPFKQEKPRKMRESKNR